MNYILTNFLNTGGMQFFLIMITFALSLGAQTWVQNRYQKYRKVLSNSQLTGYEVAQRILNRHGITYITVQENPRGGVLSDHFNPQTNVVNLSKEVYYGKTIASASIAAHEIGHVLQYHEQYGFIGLRNRVLPLAMISSQLGWTVLMIGLFSGLDSLFLIGIVLIAVIGLF
ncbi:MAG TPA: zinc metallopeptidase, partial [Erysipelothrix sp.]|nr:zinc metallopeptidase [Erysipelothrix sp.]